MRLDITFEESPLDALADGDVLSAVRFLALTEGMDEEQIRQLLEEMEQRHITLNIEELPVADAEGETALRLRRELELVRKNLLMTALEENDPLRLYLEELARIPAAGDPQLLAEALLDGREDVSERLVNLLLHRVVDLAQEHTDRGVLLLDLIQEGSLGLWQGILAYSGGDITAHCDWWIRQHLAKAVTEQARSGGIGQKLRQGLRDYVDVDQRLLGELGRSPTPEEIAEAMHVPVADVAVYAEMLTAARRRQQLQVPEEAEQEEEADQSVENTAYFQSRQRILELLSVLDEQQKQLLTLRYGLEGGLPMDPAQVGSRLGLTAEEVVKLEAAALAKLRQES